MVKSLRARWLIVLFALTVGLIWLSPNFVDSEGRWYIPDNKLTMGLDIQGGLHLVMGVDIDGFLTERLNRLARDLRLELRDYEIAFDTVEITDPTRHEITVTLRGAEARAQMRRHLDRFYPAQLQVISESNQAMVLRYFDAYVITMKEQVVEQAIEVIRNRIDEFGVAEPSIAAQGSDRVLVQLPGIQDANRAKELINRTARLDFRAVSQEIPLDQLEQMVFEAEAEGEFSLGVQELGYREYLQRVNDHLADRLPEDTRIFFEKLENAVSLEAGRRPYLLGATTELTGDLLEDAAVRMDERGRPEVTFRFGIEGRRRFASLTEQVIGGQLAIVLDDIIQSAPSVSERIDSDSARITLGATRDYTTAMQEASLIATALRAGALPATLQQLEERTVGPSLGADAIAKAQTATIWGGMLVFLFMLLWYRSLGFIADITLVINLLLTFSVLSSLGATLTLPGVAGLALTIGMAVDANIIIFERIKEELRRGASTAAAVRDGFGNAFSAIFDSNITTILTCVVLMVFGTGPIRGFAITLAIGLICSMFTAVFVSRTIMETLVQKVDWKLKPAGQG